MACTHCPVHMSIPLFLLSRFHGTSLLPWEHMCLRFSKIRCAPVGEGALRNFASLLNRCGVTNDTFLPKAYTELATSSRFKAFRPLFTPSFSFQDQQLTTYGDIIVDEYLSRVTLAYCAHIGIIMSVNTAKQLNAVFHNHFTMRLFAKELGFEQLMMPTGDLDTTGDALDFLEAQASGVQARDTAGTTFHITPLAAAQSPLGWKFSHFIGALQQTYGDETAHNALERIYGLEGTGHLGERASSLLLRILDHFPAPNVAEALLSAQGLSVRFVGKTRVLPEREPCAASTVTDVPKQSDERATDPSSDTEDYSSMLILRGFGYEPGNAKDISLDDLSSSPSLRSELALGPGAVDYLNRWKVRTNELVRQNIEPPLADSIDEGWLSVDEQQKFKWGAANSRCIDFSLHHFYADDYGVPHPQDGTVISRPKFKKPVRDPLFYDKMSDMRHGIPFSTDGELLPVYLDRFSRAHERLFEVSMVTGVDTVRTVGKAIASRYTVARESACRAFLGAVLSDLSRLSARRTTDEGVA